MYIPDEWEPAEWDDAAGKESRRFKFSKKSRLCAFSMGSDSERGTSLHVPDMPGELDGHGSGTATQVRESESPSCLVVQSPTQKETETASESRPRSSQAGFFSALPKITEADEENTGLVLSNSGRQ